MDFNIRVLALGLPVMALDLGVMPLGLAVVAATNDPLSALSISSLRSGDQTDGDVIPADA